MADDGRFAIITDLHANLEALTAVLGVIDAEGIDTVVCLGDIVGYNADPKAVIDIARERCHTIIRGNHDRYVIGKTHPDVKETSAQVIDWTREQLPPDDIDWLKGLKDDGWFDQEFLLAHGSPRDPDEYVLTNDAISGSLRHMRDNFLGTDICFFGHSHFPMVIGGGKVVQKLTEDSQTIPLDRNKTYLINAGSVGQPRDRCPKASFGIFDRKKWSVTIRRVAYDFKTTQKKIIDAGLDRSLAARLAQGK